MQMCKGTRRRQDQAHMKTGIDAGMHTETDIHRYTDTRNLHINLHACNGEWMDSVRFQSPSAGASSTFCCSVDMPPPPTTVRLESISGTLHMDMHTCIYAHMHAQSCIIIRCGCCGRLFNGAILCGRHTYTHTHTHPYTYTHAHTHACARTHTYTRTHTYRQVERERKS